MSNFAVTYLFSRRTRSGLQINIEDNIGEPMHLHLNRVRVDMDYHDFDNIVSKAYGLISETINFDIDSLKKIDPVMVYQLADYDLLKYLIKVEEDQVFVNNLIIKKNVIDPRHKTLLKKYGNNKTFNKEQAYRDYYPCNTTKRAHDYREKTPSEDEAKIYLLGDTNILIPPYDLAACNCTDKTVDVIRLYFSKDFLINEPPRVFHLIKKTLNIIKNKVRIKQKKMIFDYRFDIKKARVYLDLNAIDYLVIPSQISPINSDMLIINDEQINLLADNASLLRKKVDIINNYTYCYGIDKPTAYYKEGQLLFVNYHTPFQFSLGESVVMPFSKKIVRLTWEYSNNHLLDDRFYLLYLIANCLLNKRRFDDYDIAYVKNNKHHFDDTFFLNLMEEVFYGQYQMILSYLTNDNYSSLFEDYRKSYFHYN